MMEDELINIWKSSPNQEQMKFEKSRLMIDVQSSIDRFHRLIKYRDLMEIIPAIVMIPLFAYQVYAIPFILSKIAAAWLVAYIVFVILKLLKAKKNKPNAITEVYLKYLYNSKEYLLVQKRLLDNVVYWYILPGLSGVVLFLVGAALGGRMGIFKLSCIIVGIIILGIGISLLNKRAVKKEFVPRLKKIDELIDAMKE